MNKNTIKTELIKKMVKLIGISVLLFFLFSQWSCGTPFALIAHEHILFSIFKQLTGQSYPFIVIYIFFFNISFLK